MGWYGGGRGGRWIGPVHAQQPKGTLNLVYYCYVRGGRLVHTGWGVINFFLLGDGRHMQIRKCLAGSDVLVTTYLLGK